MTTNRLPKISANEIESGMTIRFNGSQVRPGWQDKPERTPEMSTMDWLAASQVPANVDLTVTSVSIEQDSTCSGRQGMSRYYVIEIADGRSFKVSSRQKVHQVG
jgi:hypothetical protein